MNKNELLEKINMYEAKSAELIKMFMAEEDIEKAKAYLEESKALAKTISELRKSYDRLVAREKANKKVTFISKLRDMVFGLH